MTCFGTINSPMASIVSMSYHVKVKTLFLTQQYKSRQLVTTNIYGLLTEQSIMWYV